MGVYTNLTHEHLDYHGTLEAYRNAKGILFERVGAMGGIAVINADDAYGAWFAERSRGAQVVEYGIEKGDYRPEGLVVDASGIRMTVDGDEYRTVLTGDFNVYNTLAAIAYARARGWAPDAIQRGLNVDHRRRRPHADHRRRSAVPRPRRLRAHPGRVPDSCSRRCGGCCRRAADSSPSSAARGSATPRSATRCRRSPPSTPTSS